MSRSTLTHKQISFGLHQRGSAHARYLLQADECQSTRGSEMSCLFHHSGLRYVESLDGSNRPDEFPCKLGQHYEQTAHFQSSHSVFWHLGACERCIQEQQMWAQNDPFHAGKYFYVFWSSYNISMIRRDYFKIKHH